MARGRRVHFRVSFELPEGASDEDAEAYVHDALVEAWRARPPGIDEGGANPLSAGDPMFNLDGATVQVFALWWQGKK